MLFSSSLFVFLFLPLVLAIYFALNPPLRNGFLLLASLVFYGWGEPLAIVVMLLSILANYGFARLVDASANSGTARPRAIVAVAVVFNLGTLVAFKYADWLWSVLSSTLLALGVRSTELARLSTYVPASSAWHDLLIASNGSIALPVGISFFTFQAMSYVIDVYRRDAVVRKNPLDVALYVALFPQLVAGPIVRFRDIAEQIAERTIGRSDFALGVRRFVIGLGKKTLIADTVGAVADSILVLPMAEIPPATAWLAILCYTLQIYFDFSGYSDMAIGLGRMFGFHFLENFRHPYVSTSLTEFWRRWHISLSTWFRDYLYIPLGGNQRGPARTYLNLVVVFFLCGLWHGASFNFVAWGLFHGGLLVLERLGWSRVLERAPRALGHVYVLLVVMLGWVFFRASDLTHAVDWIVALAGGTAGTPAWHAAVFLDPWVTTMLVAGVLGATPWLELALSRVTLWRTRGRLAAWSSAQVVGHLALLAILICAILQIAGGTYQPFIYFRF